MLESDFVRGVLIGVIFCWSIVLHFKFRRTEKGLEKIERTFQEIEEKLKGRRMFLKNCGGSFNSILTKTEVR